MAFVSCEVLVVGAGPAGSAAARALALQGRDVLLVDRYLFPRDKVCGDALIPDALCAIEMLGVRDEIQSQARALRGIDVYAPDGSVVRVAGEVACVSRRHLDDMLRTAAIRAGARFMAPCCFTSLAHTGKVMVCRFLKRSGADVEIRARFVVLATGADTSALQAAGVCCRRAPSGIAVRAYYRNPEWANSLDTLLISFEQKVLPGYGWIFPQPNGTLNVGTGVFFAPEHRASTINMHDLFRNFLDRCVVARQVMRTSLQLTPLKGAPLRTGLTGALLSAPGVLVVGEAAGTTYSFTGEGIGKALGTGLIAAETLDSFFRGGLDYELVPAQYRSTVEDRLRARFRGYATAQHWFRYPRLGNWIAERARKRRYVLRRLEALLAETEPATALFSLRGLGRALVAR